MVSASDSAEDVHGEGAGRRRAGGQQGAAPGGHLRHPDRHRHRALADHHLLGSQRTYEAINPETHEVETMTTTVRSLLTADGIRFMFACVVQNFMNFQRGGRDHRGDGRRRRRRRVRPRSNADPQDRECRADVGADLHHRDASASSRASPPTPATSCWFPWRRRPSISLGRHPLAGLAAPSRAWRRCSWSTSSSRPSTACSPGITNDAIHLVDPTTRSTLSATSASWSASVILMGLVVR